ncbi:unnamed protein product [Cuscuta campestris]|uniref:Uncharacterized protein n=1 Tax=Cuscuta campestris TaxID=132261 RepID=A0A484LAM8_9ASTE|nr:unnamed protein product [Cuscuta campestris]
MDVGGHDDIHDEEGVGQASLGGNGSAIRHVDHDELCPIDVGAVDDCMNDLQVFVEERGVTAVPGVKNPGEDVEEEALLQWGRVDCRCTAVADEVGDSNLSNDHRLVVEDPIVATVRREVIASYWQPCDPRKSGQINLYVVEIGAVVDGVIVTAEIGVERPDKHSIEGLVALGYEGPQTRCLELVVELVVPLLLVKQLGQHPGRRDWVFGEVREKWGEFLLRAKLEKRSVEVGKRRGRRA